MKIDFSVEEYFKELNLMEEQYGQEEDLYPWIYMLLQMAECKKKEQDKKYSGVSIRDVHNANCLSYYACKENDDYWKLRWELTKRVGPPDIAIINGTEIVGCVEIKQLGKALLLNSKKTEFSIGRPSEMSYILKYFKTGSKGTDEDKCTIEKYKGIETNKGFVVKSKCIKGLEDIAKDILCNGSKKLIANNKGKGLWKYETSELSKAKGRNQLAGHLDKFKKVIYTNGLEFYYLKSIQDSEQNKDVIKVKCLGDLSSCYEAYKKDSENFDFESEKIKEEWTKLIEGLANIEWYVKPKEEKEKE